MTGFTLPVWVTAAARCAAETLTGKPFSSDQTIQVPNAEEPLIVPVSAAAELNMGQKAMAISHCDSGLCLDIIAGLEIWVFVEYHPLHPRDQNEGSRDSWLNIVGGFGVGKLESNSEICISDFARKLLYTNLFSFRRKNKVLNLEIIFPEGRDLAERTSNRSFGIVDGLALIGTQPEAQVSASPEQLTRTLSYLRNECRQSDFQGALTVVIGENGLNLAQNSPLKNQPIIKAGNWLGPLIVAAAQEGVKKLLLVGYHGKLVKLAGGIFHTHHHLADGRLEILVALAVKEEIPLPLIKLISQATSVEAALLSLEEQDPFTAKTLWLRMANEVENKSHGYVNRYISTSMQIGAVLFDRQRTLRWAGKFGIQQINALSLFLKD